MHFSQQQQNYSKLYQNQTVYIVLMHEAKSFSSLKLQEYVQNHRNVLNAYIIIEANIHDDCIISKFMCMLSYK